MKKIRFVSLIIALIMSSSVISCGDSAVKDTETNKADTLSKESETPEYTYPDEDFGGYEFTFYSPDEQFGCNVRVDTEEQTGERLDDEIYARNRRIEDRFNCKITEVKADASEWSTGQLNMLSTITQMVMAGDSDYDAAYLPIYFQPAIVTDGYLTDLYTIPELKLGEKWWDNVINDEIAINGHLYTASGPLQFMSLDLAWVLLFNENMMDDRGIEYPYDLVREGKWTLDAFNTMIAGVPSLNGDESFTKWNGEGNSVYAIANHISSTDAFLFSAENKLMTRSGDTFTFTAATERMYSTIEKVSALLDKKSGNAYSDNGSDLSTKTGYYYAFMNNRAMFITAELKTALMMRTMESNFGLMPMPKYDEAQENYITYVNPISCFLTIPTTNPDMKRTGIILDALTYDSYKNCLPIYYDVTVSQKGLRNDDSIEMLQIVRDNRSTQVSNLYGITNKLNNQLQDVVLNGNGKAASTIAAAEPEVEANLEKVLSAFGK